MMKKKKIRSRLVTIDTLCHIFGTIIATVLGLDDLLALTRATHEGLELEIGNLFD